MTRIRDLFPSSVGKKSEQSQPAVEVRSREQTQEQKQGQKQEQSCPLRHLAIIMDGNGRWAAQRHLPRLAGHKAGVAALRRVVEAAVDEHIEYLSVYAFSTENWGRPREEVEGLMRLFWETIRSDLEKLHRDGVRLRHLGRLQDLPPAIQRAVQESVELTRYNNRIHLSVCFNYGGRAELVDAVRRIIAAGLPPEAITEEVISSYLYTHDLPDPDLVVRTAGEMRVSNFLIWQSAYSEYYSTPTLWPDFGREDLRAALESYRQRQRRFGRLTASPSGR
ncbi:MAG: di-trans,poly-cis-decaprenylcistransferase [Thermogemmatispora sp.]|nr:MULTISPECIES: polyprenyl diphosphate synthase [Thermogemmatispora]MBE3565494.1 di-trans,poly-cis-decaprenylcistransferase [Thermogemmatispora sp.]MBX5458903.1 di-trans,poly-cis-decaprenylcistransferase [Thermogemmatispora sp.]GER81480.1 isoprenyl transferase [Thermogemmatispora aurantia]